MHLEKECLRKVYMSSIKSFTSLCSVDNKHISLGDLAIYLQS